MELVVTDSSNGDRSKEPGAECLLLARLLTGDLGIQHDAAEEPYE